MSCGRCEERGKTWPGDDPVCGFPGGVFTIKNWNCATLNELRDMAEDLGVVIYNDDDYAALLTEPRLPDGRGGGYLVLKWYKHRGRTDYAGHLTDTMETLTLAVAERTLDAKPY